MVSEDYCVSCGETIPEGRHARPAKISPWIKHRVRVVQNGTKVATGIATNTRRFANGLTV